ncbi:isoprenoid biosynthesis enzyme family protein [Anaerosinus massiliensis]|uniref:hypothetical protein n=1 Tax=Massilibacillus massiliensis TaxID=1806837 RepID=UPI000DA60ADB|nr:hypothetical protein [Massilibacillus massiliensis]
MMNHEAEIIQTLTPYLMAFPQSKMNEGSLIVYSRALSSLSIAEIDAAMLKLMRTVKFFPSVAEIFDQVENVKNFASRCEIKSSDEAWREVLQEVHDAFIYRKPVFSSKEVEMAALNMGWTALCNLETDDMNTARAQFVRFYESVLNRTKDRKINIEVLNSLPENYVKKLVGSVSDKLKLVQGGIT